MLRKHVIYPIIKGICMYYYIIKHNIGFNVFVLIISRSNYDKVYSWRVLVISTANSLHLWMLRTCRQTCSFLHNHVCIWKWVNFIILKVRSKALILARLKQFLTCVYYTVCLGSKALPGTQDSIRRFKYNLSGSKM